MTSAQSARFKVALLSSAEIVAIVGASQLLSRCVDEISSGHATVQVGLPLIVGYVLCVYASTVFNVLSSLLVGWARIGRIETGWWRHLPLKVPARLCGFWEKFFVVIGEQIPRICELELSIALLAAQILTVYGFIFWRCSVSGRFELIWLGIPLLSLNYAANLFRQNALRESVGANQTERAQFLGWHKRYFASGSRLYRNWRLEEHGEFQRAWLSKSIVRFTEGLRRSLRYRAQRLCAKSLFCDLPFYLGIGYFLYLGVRGDVSVGSIFFWLTMNELLFRANSSMRELLDRRTELVALREASESELSALYKTEMPSGSIDTLRELEVSLLSGEVVSLWAKPGLQVIRASNGSGKSHLLKLLAGEDIEYRGPKDQIRSLFGGKRIFLVEPEFEQVGLSTMSEEVFGPRSGEVSGDLLNWLSTSGLPHDIVVRWREILRDLIRKYPTPQDIRRCSKGEQSLLAMARVLTFIERCELLLVDEMDGPLAGDARQLMTETFKVIGERIPVIVVSHHWDDKVFSIFERGYLLGYDAKSDEGHAIPFLLRAIEDGEGRRTSNGNVATSLMPLLDLTLELLRAQGREYTALSRMSFSLQCHVPGAKIKGIDSAGLALILALINLKRVRSGQPRFEQLAATGHVDLSGSVFPVIGLKQKRAAAGRVGGGLKVVSAEDVSSVGEFEQHLVTLAQLKREFERL